MFFLNVLTVEVRRDLTSEFNSGKYCPTLILNMALIAFIATLPDRRLGAFLGYETERRRVLDRLGDMAHLVCDGRRLGKIAILRSTRTRI